MALAFACEEFNQCVNGQQVKLVTDHKPLETIATNKIQPRFTWALEDVSETKEVFARHFTPAWA